MNIEEHQKAFSLLQKLIDRPDVAPASIPRLLDELMAAERKYTIPEPPPLTILAKRHVPIARPAHPLGWPKGVSRAEYQDWKVQQSAHSDRNPHVYKTLRDAGRITIRATPLMGKGAAAP